MPSASWVLQQAVYAAVASDVTIIALLGGARVFDDVPQRTEFPYVTLGASLLRDWSTGTDEGEEHLLTLSVWSRAAGRRQVHEVMEAVRKVLHDQPLTLLGHRLANMRHESSEARREADGDLYRGIVRFRAVTEPSV